MDNQQVKTLIVELFTQLFDRQRYEYFLRNLLNHFEVRNSHYAGNYIPAAFKQHINQYWRIGKYVDPEGEELDLLVVEVHSLAKLERARSALRNFAVDRLKKFDKEASLIAFYARDDGGKDWRFSFVKIEHQAYKAEDKVKLRQELTPAKRYSYLVGVHENSHTAARQLLPILKMDYANPRIKEIEAAFFMEKVSSEFFEQYKQLFMSLAEYLRKQPFFECDNEEETERTVSRFAKKLLGQIVFLYFLQKKGWLGVPLNGKWGTGSKRFMRERFELTTNQGGNYFSDFLQYLFYEALAREREDQTDPGYYPRFDCKIPFLNGGLFEAEYDWQNATVALPDHLFHNNEKNRAGDLGTGILDVFDRYNFTIKEDEPLEKEVAIDPEMLGKVFENMLEVTERKSKGAFYTPREIVHYMCQESLINYLDNTLNIYTQDTDKTDDNLFSNKTETESRVPRKDLEILIRKGYLALENDQRVLSTGEETDTYKFQLPETVRHHAKEIDNALASIKVCDPAIGSGAFPVGLLHEIVNTRLALAPHSGNQSTAYELKRHAIHESIYGVDIDASAIDIARLRLWLSLIVDEERYDIIDPLPNLDYKIIQGDSLIEMYQGVKLFDDDFLLEKDDPLEALRKEERVLEKKKNLTNKSLFYANRNNDPDSTRRYETERKELHQELLAIRRRKKHFAKKENDQTKSIIDFNVNIARNKANQLEDLHQEFIDITSLSEKLRLRNLITQLEWELVEATLKEQHRLDTLPELIEYKSSGEKPWFLWKLNFSEVFKQKGGFDVVIGNPPYVQIQKFSGQPIQKNWESQKYETFAKTGDIYCLFYEKGHQILRDGGVLTFITSNKWMRAAYGKKLREFFSNKTQPLTLVDFSSFQVFETATVDTNVLIFRKQERVFGVDACLIDDTFTRSTPLDIFVDKQHVKMDDLSGESWAICNKAEYEIKKRIEKVGTPLKDWDISIYRGILTGFNEAFIIDGKKKDELIAADPKSAEIIKPILRGRDIKRYRVDFADLWLIATFPALNLNIDDYPAVRDYLKSFGKKLHQTGEIIGKDKDGNIIKSRKKTGNKWFETQDQIAYYKEFEKEKIAWGNLALSCQFALADAGIYINAPSPLIGGGDRFLLAILNSMVADYYIRSLGVTRNGGYFEYKPMFVEHLPIPETPTDKKITFQKLADYLLLTSMKGKTLQTAFFEQLIDGLVYELYFFDEIKAAGKEILMHLGELLPLTDQMSEDEKLAVIHHEFDRLYDPNHSVRNNIETLDSVGVVRTIRKSLRK